MPLTPPDAKQHTCHHRPPRKLRGTTMIEFVTSQSVAANAATECPLRQSVAACAKDPAPLQKNRRPKKAGRSRMVAASSNAGRRTSR